MTKSSHSCTGCWREHACFRSKGGFSGNKSSNWSWGANCNSSSAPPEGRLFPPWGTLQNLSPQIIQRVGNRPALPTQSSCSPLQGKNSHFRPQLYPYLLQDCPSMSPSCSHVQGCTSYIMTQHAFPGRKSTIRWVTVLLLQHLVVALQDTASLHF